MRTAVVIIHGIGEQKPMETLRGSVDAIVGVSEGKQTYYSKPVTRWTNLYIRAKLGLFGDIVGGPIAPALGYGIKDIEVRTPFWRGWSDRTLRAHLSYWSPVPKAASIAATSVPIAIEELRQTIALRRREAVGPSPWGTHGADTPTPKHADQVTG